MVILFQWRDVGIADDGIVVHREYKGRHVVGSDSDVCGVVILAQFAKARICVHGYGVALVVVVHPTTRCNLRAARTDVSLFVGDQSHSSQRCRVVLRLGIFQQSVYRVARISLGVDAAGSSRRCFVPGIVVGGDGCGNQQLWSRRRIPRPR